MTKKIYICGASDCSFDPLFVGQSWHEKLADRLPNKYEINNLAITGASNFLIRLQIDRALEHDADAILIHFTSSVRTEIALNPKEDHRSLLDRFYRDQSNLDDSTLLSISRMQARHQPFLSTEQQQILEKYQLDFFDLDCAVHKNFYLIKGALSELSCQDSSKFCFSLGGFEHPDYMSSPRDTYHKLLSKFSPWQSGENLWDYFTDWKVSRPNILRPKSSEPIFHINDTKINDKIAEYYHRWIITNL